MRVLILLLVYPSWVSMYFCEAKEAVLAYKQAKSFYPKQFSLNSPITKVEIYTFQKNIVL